MHGAFGARHGSGDPVTSCTLSFGRTGAALVSREHGAVGHAVHEYGVLSGDGYFDCADCSGCAVFYPEVQGGGSAGSLESSIEGSHM
ncbi:hypothetical protein GCM10010910_21010 [Microbacterium nanhaiense]|uniref:Uncharacterized protein n=1 Tax=Microbacterium nanhaiense TaxID=1301026 RepID=A0ABQ2N384_9MICO|nr:hypothetical protein GCM10010910_21010 [Microbacterium nanhaiense]